MPYPVSEHLSSRITFSGFLVLFFLAVSAGETTTVIYAQTEEKPVAVVNGRTITMSEVDRSVTSQLIPLKRQIYAIRKTALENLILRTILEDEAKKRGVPVEELRKRLTAGKVEIPSSQVEKVYLENAAVFDAMSPDEARERIRLDQESHAHMQIYKEALLRLKGASKIELRLEEPRLPSFYDDGTAPTKGTANAIITITEFSDFQCPFCRNSQSSLNRVLQKYKKKIRLIFKHLPLSEIHPQAFASAQAAFCAGRQGLFWQYHDALFNSESLSPEIFAKLASSLGLNISEFSECINSEASRTGVLKDINEARQLGVNSTPTFIINGRLFHGSLSFEDFQTAIEHELNAAASGSRTQ